MKVHLSDHFTFKKIFLITIFPIIMMVFTSMYSIIDGIFISNFSSSGAFAAVNLVFPFIMIIGSIGFMMGTGGTALVSKLLGEQNKDKANKTFSLIIYATIVLGVIFSIVGYFLMTPIVEGLGSLSPNTTSEMVEEGIVYGKILVLGQVGFMLQNVFQSFFMVAEKSKLGFLFVVMGGVTNIILDALLIGIYKLGVVGAAIATIAGYVVAGVGPLIYFIRNKKGIIYLGKCEFDFKSLLFSMYNGLSEFVSNIAMSVVSIVFNAQLLKAYGEEGVSAYGIIMYVSFIFMAMFIGYSLGMAPVVGYNYGAKNKKELNNVFKKSIKIILAMSVVMFLFSYLTAKPFSLIFTNSESLVSLSTYAMKVYSFTFLVCGFSIFSSCFFTALNNGTISALISLFRTLVFQIVFVLILPLFFGPSSIWWSITLGEVMCTVMAIIFILVNRKRYGY